MHATSTYTDNKSKFIINFINFLGLNSTIVYNIDINHAKPVCTPNLWGSCCQIWQWYLSCPVLSLALVTEQSSFLSESAGNGCHCNNVCNIQISSMQHKFIWSSIYIISNIVNPLVGTAARKRWYSHWNYERFNYRYLRLNFQASSMYTPTITRLRENGLCYFYPRNKFITPYM